MTSTNWFYLDMQGREQGPFAEVMMRKWFKAGYIVSTVRMRREGEVTYTPLGDLDASFKKDPPAQQKAIVDYVADKSRKRAAPDDGFAAPVAKKKALPAAAKPKESGKDTQWIYLDRAGKIQGPYSNAVMGRWYKQKHLPPTLPVKIYEPSDKDVKSLPRSAFTEIKSVKDCSFVESSDSFAAPAPKAPARKTPAEAQWFYKDKEGEERGPFSTLQMRKWYQRQAFPMETPVRSSEDGIWIPLVQRAAFFREPGMPDPNIPEVPDHLQTMWFYLDDENFVRGPYSWTVIKAWHDKEWLPFDVQVKRQGEKHFIPWGDRFKQFMQQRTLGGTLVGQILQGQINNPLLNALTQAPQPVMPAAPAAQSGGIQLIQRENQEDLYAGMKAKSEDKDKWYYLDFKNGQSQGPFNTGAMSQWYNMGFFPAHTQIRKNEESSFRPLAEIRPVPEFVVEALKAANKSAPKPADPSAKPVKKSRFSAPKPNGPVPNSPDDWFYLGGGGKQIGPFSLHQMSEWVRAKHFNHRVMVKKGTSKEYVAIHTTACWDGSPVPVKKAAPAKAAPAKAAPKAAAPLKKAQTISRAPQRQAASGSAPLRAGPPRTGAAPAVPRPAAPPPAPSPASAPQIHPARLQMLMQNKGPSK